MQSFSWLLLLAITPPALHGRHFPLPASAKITTGAPTNIAKHGSGDEDRDCSKFQLTEKQIRKQFATYRLLSGPDFHDFYDIYPCNIRGTVTVHGKNFEWESNEGNWISTTYPDGNAKELGGKPSGFVGW